MNSQEADSNLKKDEEQMKSLNQDSNDGEQIRFPNANKLHDETNQIMQGDLSSQSALKDEEDKISTNNNQIKYDKKENIQNSNFNLQFEDQDNNLDCNVEDEQDEEKKDNQSNQTTINSEGPLIKTIPSLFPKTNIMHLRDQKKSNELILPFDQLNEIVQTLIQKEKYSKWKSDFQDILLQFSQLKQNITNSQLSSTNKVLRDSQLDLILEQLTIIRSQFQYVSDETRNLSDENETDKANLSKIEDLLDLISQGIIKLQRQQVNEINQQNNSQSNVGQSNETQNNNQNINRNNEIINNQNNNTNQSNRNNQNVNNQNNQIPNQNNNQNNNNNPINNNVLGGQRVNINGQDIRVVRTYSLSLDLQIFQQLFQGFYQVFNYFDLLLKSIIILSSAFLMITYKINEQNIFIKTGNTYDPFIDMIKWMAFGKESKLFIMNFIVLVSFSIVFIWRSLWKKIVGQFTDEQRIKVKENLFRFCVFKHLIIIKILDDSIWTNNFDLIMFFCINMQADTSRFFTEIIESSTKTILNSMSEDYEKELKHISNFKMFNTLLLIWNLTVFILNLIIFNSVNPFVQIRLFFGLFIAIIWNIRILLNCNNLISQNGIQYYVNCNSDIISEPTLSTELTTNFILQSIKLSYLFYLLLLYFDSNSIEVFQYFFIIYYFVFCILSTLKKLSQVVQNKRNTSYFQKNIDEIFPKLEITESNKDDFCTICHDQLLVGRRLKDCSHAFHLKCLFQWIKTQPQPKCPNCRVDIRNVTQLSSALNPQQQNAQNNNLNQNLNIGRQFGFQQVNIQQGNNAQQFQQ